MKLDEIRRYAHPLTPVGYGGELFFIREEEGGERAEIVRRAFDMGLLEQYGKRSYGIYTSDLKSPPEQIVLRNWPLFVRHLCPDAVLTYRSAFALRPEKFAISNYSSKAHKWSVVLSGAVPKVFELPEFNIKVMKGPERVADDQDFLGVNLAGVGRRWLDNLTYGRLRSAFGIDEVTNRLQALFGRQGKRPLYGIVEKAEAVVPHLDAEASFVKLKEIVDRLVWTHKALNSSREELKSVDGPPDQDIDAIRYAAVRKAALALADLAPDCLSVSGAGGGYHLQIEAELLAGHDPVANGPVFRDAQGIKKARRWGDARVRYAVRLYEAAMVMAGKPSVMDGDAFARHLVSIASRIVGPDDERQPRADVRGLATAGEAMRMASEIVDPFNRACFLYCLVRLCAPFGSLSADLAALVMNAELSASGQARISIPPVVTPELTRAVERAGKGDVVGLHMLLSFCRRVTDACHGARLKHDSARLLATTYAFCDPERAILAMPDPRRKLAVNGRAYVPLEYLERLKAESDMPQSGKATANAAPGGGPAPNSGTG